MSDTANSQSFNVDDIRRVREEDELRYRGMTPEEISHDIHERAQEGWNIIRKIQLEKGINRRSLDTTSNE